MEIFGLKAISRSDGCGRSLRRWHANIAPIYRLQSKYVHLAYPYYGLTRRICTPGQLWSKELTRCGHLSSHSAPIEVGPRPWRPARCPLESSNGGLLRTRLTPRFLFFIGKDTAAPLGRMMAHHSYATTMCFEHSTQLNLGTLYHATVAAWADWQYRRSQRHLRPLAMGVLAPAALATALPAIHLPEPRSCIVVRPGSCSSSGRAQKVACTQPRKTAHQAI